MRTYLYFILTLASFFGIGQTESSFLDFEIQNIEVSRDSIQPILSREVIYVAMKNEIQIWVPGAEKVDVKNKEVKKIDGHGTFTIRVISPRQQILNLEIEAVFPDGSKSEYEVPLRIKTLGKPYVEINGFNGSQTLSVNELQNAEITVSIKDPYFDSRFSVERFIIIIDDKPYRIEGNQITEQVFKVIKSSISKEYLFTNVAYSLLNSEMYVCKVHPLKVRIENE
ncbi:hypothetical protein BST97_04820 [Nonlabens spongiae]|uniref:Uncharacterized protein n=1 Tax=Nonlabens spongiae TaxID=331648 RepID=A0A1W6MIG0_9FLAO|nr:GldM family protein [Nonlabens spongiae]ARN77357.1 hypothetical protein BST97_04820 [Nonlabens spongiae]